MAALRIAWRNLMRNPRRTAITGVAVALNTAVLIFALAFTEGMVRQAVRNVTDLLVGDVQAHAPRFLSDRSIYHALERPERLLAAAAAMGVRAAPRSLGAGLVSSGPKSSGGLFWGVDPQAERATFALPRRLALGRFLTDAAQGEVVVGQKLARSLHIAPGDELVVVVQAADGSLGNELFRVAGVFMTVGEEIDRGAVVMHREDFARLFASGGRVHEIAFAGGGVAATEMVAALRAAAPGAEIKTWAELMPAVHDIVKVSRASLFIVVIIFMLAASFGLLNTMLMATHDRVREYGMVKALGASPLRIVRDVSVEAVLLGMVGALGGVLVGVAGSWYFEAVGLDLRSLSGTLAWQGLAFDPIWKSFLMAGHVVWSVVTMVAACVLASLYPAWRAARLDPVRAMSQV